MQSILFIFPAFAGRFSLSKPADPGRKICEEVIFLAKISPVAAVHAAGNDCSLRTIRKDGSFCTNRTAGIDLSVRK